MNELIRKIEATEWRDMVTLEVRYSVTRSELDQLIGSAKMSEVERLETLISEIAETKPMFPFENIEIWSKLHHEAQRIKSS